MRRFLRFRFARPFEAFLGHGPIFGGRFHSNVHPLSSSIRCRFRKSVSLSPDSTKELLQPGPLSPRKQPPVTMFAARLCARSKPSVRAGLS
jgi:hypothetical protein